MERKNFRELLEFAQDEKRVDEVINNIVAGIENGTIDPRTLPLAAPPIRPSLMNDTQQAYLADLMVKVSGVELNAEQLTALLATIRDLPVEATMKDLETVLVDHSMLSKMGKALRESNESTPNAVLFKPENRG
ncbi:hypothetical protein GIW05_00630 [Pseudomonas syringae]|uniref:hypothetical protein n=1 Tax=Pseudomonas syringae TaxID=317 RepID=UPI001F259EF5|nr:hypothetical protein [Pseudomonas syringae]MCF5382026.1 hypothetical protein [Pseudomonas syringae]MCF5419441.1 hypothetical protein [Pseudomonas syringae]MCF5451987.1 hypothetical protein [Pseudomonas syringae]MCF5456274.1 hypothetical protein [Pseudomonas syringae]